MSPERADVSSHAGAGDDIDFNAIFLQDLDNADVRKTFCRARRQSEADQAATNFAGDAADIGMK